MRQERIRRQRLGWALLLAIVVCWTVLAFGVRAEAADEWDVLLPDEYGLALFVVPVVVEVERATATLSWQAFTVKDWGAYATILRPYYRGGFGLDVGITKRKIRFGGGYLDAETKGLYLRRAF